MTGWGRFQGASTGLGARGSVPPAVGMLRCFSLPESPPRASNLLSEGNPLASFQGEAFSADRRRYAEAVTRVVTQPCASLAQRLGWKAARAAIIRTTIEAARALPAEASSPNRKRAGDEVSRLRAELARLFASLPEGDPGLGGSLIAAVAEHTLPPSARGSLGAVYTEAGMAGFAIDEGVRALGAPPGRVLDPACGAGVFLVEAAQRFGEEGTLFCGTDRDSAALEAARTRLDLLGISKSRVSLRAGDSLESLKGTRFDLVIGNPPYIRQEWLGGHRTKRAIAARLERYLPGAGAALDMKADLSVAFLLLGLARLRPGGVLTYVTSNAWLDALYGAPLRKFLAERAELRLVAEWEGKAFAHAAANPVVVVIRRPDKAARRPAIFARYSPSGVCDRRARKGNNETGTLGAWEAHRRAVSVRQLASESRWGTGLLRRTDLLDEIHRRAAGAFAPLSGIAALHYGTKPGLVDFFVVDGKTSEIESRFLIPVLASTSEVASLEVRPGHLPKRLFICALSRAELRKGRFHGALAHVIRGERSRTRKRARHTRPGLRYPEVPSLRGNDPWYSLRLRPQGDFAVPLLIRERHMIPYAPEGITASNMFYLGRFTNRALALPGTAILNSSAALMALESLGRINIGGRINVYGPEIRPLLVPDPQRMKGPALRAIARAFAPLRKRPVGTVSSEVHRPDRQALDTAVIEGVGLPRRYVALLAEALEERISRRLQREIATAAPF